MFQEDGIPGVCYDQETNTLVPIPKNPNLQDHHFQVNADLDPGQVPNKNHNQNPHQNSCAPHRPRRMGDDLKLTAISKLPKFDGETEGHKCPITFKIQTESAWKFINGLSTPQGGLTDVIREA